MNLLKFDISNIKPNNVVVYIGKTRSGKSYLVNDLLYHNRDLNIHNGLILSNSQNISDYINLLPYNSICKPFADNIIDDLIINQININSDNIINQNSIQSSLLILDDIIDIDWTQSNSMKTCILNSKYYNIFSIITMQYCILIPQNIRCNFDYVFILKEDILSNLKILYNQYCTIIPSFDIFCQVIDYYTKYYNCIVIDNTNNSNKIQDHIYWYKAMPHDISYNPRKRKNQDD